MRKLETLIVPSNLGIIETIYLPYKIVHTIIVSNFHARRQIFDGKEAN